MIKLSKYVNEHFVNGTSKTQIKELLDKYYPQIKEVIDDGYRDCLLYTSPSPRDS